MTSNRQSSELQLPWEQAGWVERVSGWAADQVRQTRPEWERQPEVVHQTPWSAVVKFANEDQQMFLKAVTQPFRHEIPLTELLAAEFPSVSPVVLASDLKRGWLLMRSGGQRLREAASDREIVDHWVRLLPVYAGLQLDLSTRSDELLEMGVPDRRPARLAEQYAGLIEEAVRGGSATDESLTGWEVKRLEALGPRIYRRLELLSSSPIAESLDHGDLHDGNVFTDRGTHSFFDWGDAGVSVPFFSLRTLEVSIENRLGEPALLEARPALREAYLQPWVDRGRLGWTDARDLLTAAEQVWSIESALRWRWAIQAMPPGKRGDYLHVLPSLLREVIEAAGDREVH